MKWKEQSISNISLLIVFLGIGILMIVSSLFEAKESKKELMELMRSQSHIVLESLIASSVNNLKANEYYEDQLSERLLNNAYLLRNLYQNRLLTSKLLHNIARKNHLFRVFIVNRSGEIKLSNMEKSELASQNRPNFIEVMDVLFKGTDEERIIGLKSAENQSGVRFAVALKLNESEAVILNIDANELLKIRMEFGFGSLIKKIATNKNLRYVVLQDTAGIIAASAGISELDRIIDSPALLESFTDSIYMTRIAHVNGERVFEAVHPFYYDGIKLGLFRIGLSLDAYNAITNRIYTRFIIITVILSILGSILFRFIIQKEKLFFIKKQIKRVETFSSNVVEAVSEAILVYQDSKLIFANRHAKKLFKLDQNGMDMSSLLSKFKDIPERQTFPAELEIDGEIRQVIMSGSYFEDEHNRGNWVIIVRDITEYSRLHDQLEQSRRLSAMGTLAAGVAHEIRNPLNSISTIVQQLNMDFSPTDDEEDYHRFLNLVYHEIERIENTMTRFLNFTKPETLSLTQFKLLNDLLKPIYEQYKLLLENENIEFQFDVPDEIEVRWDLNKMRQVLINLIENSRRALKGRSGTLQLTTIIGSDKLKIILKDSGKGIPEDKLKYVFDLFYTTHAEGTGIGLAMVKRIVEAHHGKIEIESVEGEGTKVTLELPIYTNFEG